jgi:hypothetical protein
VLRLLLALLVLVCAVSCSDASGTAPASTGGAGTQLPAGAAGMPTEAQAVPPGRSVLRRLNRSEYNSTLRDLLGTSEQPAANLPAEDLSFGFDNIGAALNVSALHVETYASAADQLIEKALLPGAPLREQILTCDVNSAGTDCTRQILRSFGRRAFRRPLTEEQLTRLMAFSTLASAQGDPPLVGVQLALKAMLVSARFLFRIELDPEPKPSAPWLVDDFEVASRLSYFLWSSMPDETLLQRAEAAGLQNESGLQQEVERMLADPRASELTTNFAGQWLFVRSIPRHQPDLNLFPEFNGELGASMQRSTELFFSQLIERRTPLEALVTADQVPVDSHLARLYGITPAGTADFTSVAAPEGRRAGVLGHAGLLMVTSEPGRTSPVKRGAWVLGNLLCSPPPAPPPGVEGLDESVPGAGETLTVRQRLEQHRTNPACAACHNLMDPIGFGLETFDAIGRFRTTDAGQPLDTTGTLPDGTSFTNAEELGRIVAADPRFRPCVAQKLATYALGRGVDASADAAFVASLAAETTRGDGSLLSLISALVKSPPFRMRAPDTNGAL